MARRSVTVATLLLVLGCGEDPILARARDEAASAAGQPAGAPAAGPSPSGSAGDPSGGVGIPAEPAPGVPNEPPPGAPAGPDGAPPAGAAGEPPPGVPTEPTPGVPTAPPPGTPGAPPPITGPTTALRGRVDYPTWTRGEVRIDAFDGDHSKLGAQPGIVASVRMAKPGEFTLLVPAGAGKVYLEAVVDEDADGRPGPQDPMGRASRYPVTVGTAEITGLDIKLVKREPPPGGGRPKSDY